MRTHTTGPKTGMVAIALAIALLIPTMATAQLTAGQRIGDSEDPTAASLQISSTVADGAASRVVLGRNDSFPDNLAGAAVAGDGGVLLLVEPASSDSPGLADEIGAEIQRLLPADQPETCGTGVDAEVILLGGPAALSPQLETDLAEDFCVDRLAGESRNETSVAATNAVVAGTGDGQRGLLLVAVDNNPADSAAAGAYAAATNTPIVVTPTNRLDASVAALLAPGDDPWDRVILLGGEAALSAEVMALIQDAAGPDTAVSRIAGATRDDTALQIVPGLWGDAAGDGVAIVNGIPDNFWIYALPGGVAAGQQSFPLLYVRSASVPDTTAGYLQANNPAVISVGPASVLTDEAKNAAEAAAGGEGGSTGGGPTTPPGDDADLRVIPLDLTPAGDSVTVTVPVQAGDYAVTVVARSGAADAELFVDGITGPNIELGQDQMPPNQQFGDVALTFPFLPDQSLQAGDYTFTLFAEGGGGFASAQAIVKSGSPDTRMLLDANFYVVTDHASVDEQSERDALGAAFRGVGEEIFSQQNLGVGQIQFFEASAQLKQQHSTLLVPPNDEGNPENTRSLCGALRAESGQSRALNFAIVDQINDIGGNDGGGQTEGIAAGSPGVPYLIDTTNSCVVIIADGGRPISELGTTTWHEAGHFLGLFHTTERSGGEYDPLPDTPECPASRDSDGDGFVTEDECGALAQNFMFWDSDNTTMTAHQAFVMRHNPLFRPAS